MVHYRRNYVPGGTYFFTATLHDRQSDYLNRYFDELCTAFRIAKKSYPFRITAMAILPEHLHTIWELPRDDFNYTTRWRRIKTIFTQRLLDRGVPLQRGARGRFTLWQPRYWEHTVRDEADLTRCIDYIHYNPVKHGYVESPKNWKYSTFHDYVKQGLLSVDWGSSMPAVQEGDYGERI